MLLGQANSSLAENTFVETTYDDPDWVLAISDLILREDYCSLTGLAFDKVFEPCYNDNRYWKLASGAETGLAFPMSLLEPADYSLDSLYVREGFGFQLYDPSLDPNGPYMNGPRYVSLTHWFSLDPDGFEPGTFFVPGGKGDLANYSIVVYAEPPTFSKVDNVDPNNCVSPGDYVTYTINYGNPVTDPNNQNYRGDINDVNIVDYLPDGVDYPDPFDPNYDMFSHTYTWNIGTLSPGEANSITLTVKVNENTMPGGTIANYCEMRSNFTYHLIAEIDTNVCCWDAGIIYVDKDANTGSDTGMSWSNAYTDLQSAFERAGACDGSQIWVAAGTYKPTTKVPDYAATFELVDAVPVYGGFAGAETNRSQRNWVTNETVLSGDIDGNVDNYVNYVVSGSDVNQTTLIDGFTIKRGYDAGIKVDGGSPTIENNKIIENGYDVSNSGGIYHINQSSANIKNCRIQSNDGDGIHSSDSNLNITNCLIEDNAGDGIYNNGSPFAVVTNNIIRRNADHGIYSKTDTVETEIKNNWIYDNGTDSSGDGIYIDNDYAPPKSIVIRNNTVTKNADYGIRLKDNYPTDVNISNCIVWDNTGGELDNCTTTYSCVKNGNTSNGNINSDPCFVDADANNYHLSPDSPCIDAGNPNFADFNETDIDGEPRVVNSRVDIGADEYYWSPADFNRDEIVNFFDYALLANAWQTTSGEPDFNDIYDLDDNNDVDIDDLRIFCEDWLWQSAWTQTAEQMMMSQGTDQGTTESISTSTALAEQLEEQPAEKSEPLDIEEMIEWLEELWLTDEEVQKVIDEDEWLKFIESLKEQI